jgi:hypothetical protein
MIPAHLVWLVLLPWQLERTVLAGSDDDGQCSLLY